MAAGGGAWKVAYADFVTAMMAFFLVMWLTTQPQEIKTAVAGYFADPWGTTSVESSPVPDIRPDLTAPQPGIEVPRRPPAELTPKPKDLGATGSESESYWITGYRMQVLQEGDRIPPAATILFAGETAALDADATRAVDEVATPILGKANRLEIRAHSSRRPLSAESPYDDHWELGFARAQTVMRRLVELGVEPERIRLSQSATHEPLVNDLENTWHRENSRVEIFVLSEWTIPRPGTKRWQEAIGDKSSPIGSDAIGSAPAPVAID